MYIVLIADDEKIEREGIRMLLERSGYDLEVLEAENGEAALQIFDDHVIDILFTDIKMPFIDGLELMVQANKIQKNLKTIIFSAFADFHYAKFALDHRCLHYFLKPIDPDEFQSVLTEVVHYLDQERQSGFMDETVSLEKKFRLFLKGEGAPPREIGQYLTRYGSGHALIFDFYQDAESAVEQFYQMILEKEKEETIWIPLQEGGYFFLTANSSFRDKEYLLKQLNSCGIHHTCVILGKSIQRIEDLSLELEKMDRMRHLTFFIDGNQVFSTEVPGVKDSSFEPIIEKLTNEILLGFRKNNFQYIRENLKMFYDEFRQDLGESQIYIKYCYANLLQMIYENKRMEEQEFRERLEKVFLEKSLSNINNIFLDLAKELLGECAARKNNQQNQKSVIKEVVKIIDGKYSEDINLQSLAKDVYLSPSYLSFLFKKEVGITLIKYITMTRLARAKELLVTTNMKISDIAKVAGYQNYSYFNMIFKSHVGETPSQFRENNPVGTGTI